MTETVVAAEVLSEVRGQVGFITLNRPRALNALSLGMVRDLMATLLAWQADDRVLAVAIRGSNKEGPFGAFCAGGDIRFLHQAGSQGNPLIEDFFTEEYALNHLIHNYTKPYIAFMDGIVMGGGMIVAASRRCTPRSASRQRSSPRPWQKSGNAICPPGDGDQSRDSLRHIHPSGLPDLQGQ